MARPLSELQALMLGLTGVQQAYIQPPTSGMVYPSIMIERGSLSSVKHADNLKFLLKKAYTITAVCREPDSSVPDQVEALPYAEFNRYFRANGLHHYVFSIFF